MARSGKPVQVYFDPQEKAELLRRARRAGKGRRGSMSAYLRLMALAPEDRRLLTQADRELIAGLASQVRAAGVNLNQLLHDAHLQAMGLTPRAPMLSRFEEILAILTDAAVTLRAGLGTTRLGARAAPRRPSGGGDGKG